MDNIMWTDSHAHIHDIDNKSIDEYEKEAKDNNVYRIVTIGTDYNDSLKALEKAKQFDNIYASCGIHPESADKYNNEKDYNNFLELAKHDKVIAVGEIGLDFYYEENPGEELQTKLFTDMIDIACKVDKPIVIHSRNATSKCLDVLNKAYIKYNNLKGIFHCFDGSLEVIDWVQDKNFYISYAGNVTFKTAENLRAALLKTPINKLLIETDSPYLAPVPVRGKPNKPANVAYTAEYIANILQIELDKLSSQLEDNFLNLMQGVKGLWK